MELTDAEPKRKLYVFSGQVFHADGYARHKPYALVADGTIGLAGMIKEMLIAEFPLVNGYFNHNVTEPVEIPQATIALMHPSED